MHKARLTLPPPLKTTDIAILGEALSDVTCAHSALRDQNADDGPWNVEWIFEAKPERADLNARVILTAELNGIPLPGDLDWQIEAIDAEVDWLAHSYKQFPPFSVGPFFIYGSHYEGDVPNGQMGLQIDAATAFGSGEHGTTKGCLQAMLDLKGKGQCPWNVLDMGTGSGILAIAAWKLWKTPVLAVDNDEEAVRVAERHREINKVPGGKTEMTSACGDGFREETTQRRKPFDLVIANILAGPLMDMAADLKGVCDENGYVILSGILNEQAPDVIKTYEAQGLRLKNHQEIGEWSTLILHNSAS